MPRCLKAAWFVVLGMVVTAPTVRAQVPEKLPSPPIDPDWSYTSPGPAKCVEIGNVYLHKGDLKGALSRFQEAVKDNPHYAPAYLGLGKVYERMKEKQKALRPTSATSTSFPPPKTLPTPKTRSEPWRACRSRWGRTSLAQGRVTSDRQVTGVWCHV